MKERKVTVIPASNRNGRDPGMGTPGKIHVVGYAQVIKGTGAGVQIRKKLRRLISGRPEWELTFVRTDYRHENFGILIWRAYFTLAPYIKEGYLDVLLIDSYNDLEGALSIAEILIPLCKDLGVMLNIVHDDKILSESEITGLLAEQKKSNTLIT